MTRGCGNGCGDDGGIILITGVGERVGTCTGSVFSSFFSLAPSLFLSPLLYNFPFPILALYISVTLVMVAVVIVLVIS